MARATKPSFVDVGNPALAIDCPNCGLLTPRFLQYCKNCGFSLWPSGPFASGAFQAWRGAEPERAHARRFDLEIPVPPAVEVIDYEDRAHQLGIHVTPSSNFPFVICVGFFFLALAAVPFSTPARVLLGVLGAAFFLTGVVGWVVFEDTRYFPHDDLVSHGGPAQPGAAHNPAHNPEEHH